MHSKSAALGFLLLTPAALAATEPQFTTTRLTDAFYSEGAAAGDLNKDGHVDLVAGPFAYYGPDFTMRSEIYPPVSHDPHGYSKSFIEYIDDVNGDGWPDIVEIGFPGEQTWWYANPAGQRSPLVGATRGHWDRHLILEVTDNESPTWGDITGDGKNELIAQTDGKFGYSTPDASDPTKPWTFHAISPKGDRQRFTHGIGFGDVNGDGKPDLLEKTGWWEQPASLEGDPEWKYHPVNFAGNAAQMYAYDVNGDGLNDVITALQAHGWGLAWYEQTRENDEIKFKQHMIMGERGFDNPKGVCFSQLHAIDLVDMDGDKLPDIVTGKRFWAHGPSGDADPDSPPVAYYFKLVRDGSKVSFEPVLISDMSGVGTQVMARDVNGDGKPDVIVGNKLGTFVSVQK
ncbi:MAG: VCBS repeat-containing protein [Planctomycetaceae bacterium]|nr:VCBS repeat-containing protein [Planctomycetaceae bacterium]